MKQRKQWKRGLKKQSKRLSCLAHARERKRRKEKICDSFKHLMILPHGWSCKSFIAVGLTYATGLFSYVLSASFTHLNRSTDTFSFSRANITLTTIAIFQSSKSSEPIYWCNKSRFQSDPFICPICYQLNPNIPFYFLSNKCYT